jgi:small-conductance mechanosensitive channel
MLVWLAATAAAVAVTLLVVIVAVHVTMRLFAQRPLALRLLQRMRAPIAVVLAAVTVASSTVPGDLSSASASRISHGAAIAIIGACGWFASRLVGVLVDEWITTIRVDRVDNLRARTARTQLVILRRLASVAIGVVVVAASLWTFDQVRTLGASLLASAGIISVVAGIAAQSSLANLFAGLQIAFSSPIRYDDVVVVEGQWGRVEDITLTYVVVRTWDERRVILPCTWFTQNPFENWTRPTSALLAPVELQLDHCVDVDRVRADVEDFTDGHPLWDRRVRAVQVTDAGPSSVTLRVLLSARNASEAFDLRCEVRERVIAFLREHQAEALPGLRVRADAAARAGARAR